MKHDGSYYADGDKVFRAPLRSETGISVGFLVCQTAEYIDGDAAKEIADALNEVDQLKAQIAAKDAALRATMKEMLYIHGRGGLGLDVHGVMDGWIGRIDAVLHVPAREDAMIEATEVSAENRQETT